MSTKKNIKGFTIIEVVLVLAIAGLIFLMVFVALPALQSGQRDTARKQDLGNVGTAINNYSAANRGKLPATASALGTVGSGYLSAISGNITTVDLRSGVALITAADGTVNIVTGARCPTTAVAAGTKAITPVAGTARQYVLITLLEGGGGTAYCQES